MYSLSLLGGFVIVFLVLALFPLFLLPPLFFYFGFWGVGVGVALSVGYYWIAVKTRGLWLR